MNRLAHLLNQEPTPEQWERFNRHHLREVLVEKECTHPKSERHGSGYLELQYCLKCGKEVTQQKENK